jgi:RHS repeat-associated protein
MLSVFPRSSYLLIAALLGLASFSLRAEPVPKALLPTFTLSYADAEISSIRILPEALAKRSGVVTKVAENQALAQAVLAYASQTDRANVAALTSFLSSYPNSAWNASLHVNLGLIYYDQGYFSRALTSWELAWNLAKTDAGGAIKAIADRAFSEWVRMLARLGRMDALTRALSDAQGRTFTSSAQVVIDHTKDGLWLMQNQPGTAFKCGPYAVGNLLSKNGLMTGATSELIRQAQSTASGTSLASLRALASSVGLNYQVARRTPGAALLYPAVIHWQIGHYAALVEARNGKSLITDPTFGQESLIGSAAIDVESSGYFLVPAGPLPAGWTAVADTEAGTVWGKGQTSGNDPKSTTPCDKKSGTGCAGSKGMATYSVHSLLCSLNINDTPVGYDPPVGPSMQFTLTYNQRDIGQTGTLNYSNFGALWTHGWFSYVRQNSGSADVFMRGGGTRTVTGFNSSTQAYAPEQTSRAVLVKTSTTSFEQRYPDGSKDVFAKPDGSGKFFLTQIVDSTGNTVTLAYDAQYRLTTATDALGKVTTFAYTLAADAFKITRITDPFGRFAAFAYSSDAARNLIRITDTIGLTSEFGYGGTNGTEITALTTAYGTTQFTSGTNGLKRWVEITDPAGDKERTEYRDYEPSIPYSENFAPSSATNGLTSILNNYMYYRNTFFWDKKAMAEGYPDVTKAHIDHWLHDSSLAGRILESEKSAYESRIWYLYPGQYSAISMNSSMKGSPSVVARKIPGPTGELIDQIRRYDYDDYGHLLKSTDPLGRSTSYVYAANTIDLLEVRQSTGSTTYDVVARYTYNSQHLPLTVTDAAGQVTTFTYNSAGQRSTVTNPKGEVTSYFYNPTGNPALARNAASTGYLVAIDGPLPGTGDTTMLAYDSTGRTQTLTDPEGYALTFTYDNLDRPLRTTYPDGTFEETAYNKLDVASVRDREARVTSHIYNTIRQRIQTTDPLSRVTAFEWCKCGAMKKLTDPAGRVTLWKHDAGARLTAKVYPDGSETKYLYETAESGNFAGEGLSSRLRSVVDAAGQQTRYRYFADDRVSEISYPNARITTPTVSYSYATNYPRLSGMTDGTGSTTYGYFPVNQPGAGRLSSVDGPLANDTQTFTYDSLSRELSRALNGTANTRTRQYDVQGRVTQEVNPLGTFGLSYATTVARLTAVTYPNGQRADYGYFPIIGNAGNGNQGDRRLSQLRYRKPGGAELSQFDYTYSASGNIRTWSQRRDTAAADLWTLGYDAADQLTSAQVSTGGTPAPGYAYAYDLGGNRTQEQALGTLVYAGHNELNQVTGLAPTSQTTSVRIAGTVNQASVVTANGQPATGGVAATSFAVNLPLAPGASTVTLRATTPAPNNKTTTQHYAVPVGSSATVASFVYDPVGNLVSQKGGTVGAEVTYAWDAANRLVKISKPGAVTEFVYDGLSRRVAEKYNGNIIKRWIWFNGDAQPAEERDASNGVTRRFYSGMGEQIGVTNYFYTVDHLGSVRELTDGTGAVRARYAYDPYGRRTKVSGDLEASFGYTGYYQHSASGLSLALYRAFNPRLGRFISRDPIEEKGGVNLYGYVLNDPINLWDSLGDSPNGSRGRAFIRAQIKNPACQASALNEFNSTWNESQKYGYLGPATLAGTLAVTEAAALVAKDVKVDGPKANKDGVTGRLCQLRYRSTPLLRLDYHKIPGPLKDPVLHLNIGPWEGPNSIHIPIQWNPGPGSTPPF